MATAMQRRDRQPASLTRQPAPWDESMQWIGNAPAYPY